MTDWKWWKNPKHLDTNNWIHVDSCQMSCLNDSDADLIILSSEAVKTLPTSWRGAVITQFKKWFSCKVHQNQLWIWTLYFLQLPLCFTWFLVSFILQCYTNQTILSFITEKMEQISYFRFSEFKNLSKMNSSVSIFSVSVVLLSEYSKGTLSD